MRTLNGTATKAAAMSLICLGLYSAAAISMARIILQLSLRFSSYNDGDNRRQAATTTYVWTSDRCDADGADF